MDLTIQQVLELALEAQSNGELGVAELYYKKVLTLAPNQADANHNLGRIKVATGDTNAALTLFKTALSVKPSVEQYWFSYIEALITDTQYQAAGSLISQATQHGIASKKLDALRKKTNQQRKPVFEKGLGSDATIRETLTEYARTGRLREAEELARSISESSPTDKYIWKYLGDILTKLGKSTEALDANRMAVELDKFDPEAHNNLGNTLKNLNDLDSAMMSYSYAIELKPDYADAYFNKGITLQILSRYEDAENSFRRALQYNRSDAEAYNNLGIVLQLRDKNSDVEECFRRAIDLKHDYAEAHNNLGYFLKRQGRLDEAHASCIQAVALKTNFAEAHSNLGLILQEMGKLNEARDSCLKAIELKPDLAEPHNSLGIILSELGRLDEAKGYYVRASTLKERYAEAYWNLSGVSRNIPESEYWIDKCLEADPSHLRARLTKSALRFYQGDKQHFEAVVGSEFESHPYARSFAWVFKLPTLPPLFFNRWDFFDAIIERIDTARPFYEFGVWRGASFRYLIKHIKKGYGFDSFDGLPTDWVVGSTIEKKGSYSSHGDVPEIEGAEFIVGEFKDTLPRYFSENRPIASIVNLDSDLYSSTLCALTFSKDIIDRETVLIFDEFLINENWEEGEFQALTDFCSKSQISYDVIAVSFFTKQVAVKLSEAISQ